MGRIRPVGVSKPPQHAYFTRPHVVQQCLQWLETHLSLAEYDRLVEPSAGNGAFFNQLDPDKRWGCDLTPLAPGIVQADFLTMDLTLASQNRPKHRVLAIGNPPFGRQASIARHFLRRCFEFCDVVAFILPRSLEHAIAQRLISPTTAHLQACLPLPPDAFVIGERVCNLSCSFQLWVRRSEPRAFDVISSHPDFECAYTSSAAKKKGFETHADAFSMVRAGIPVHIFDRTQSVRLYHSNHPNIMYIIPRVPNLEARFRRIDWTKVATDRAGQESFPWLPKYLIVQAYAQSIAAEPRTGPQ